MRWWILEDALRSHEGHWVEYLSTFKQELQRVGDEAVFFCDREAESEIVARFAAVPALPRSIWKRMSLPVGKFTRLWWMMVHGMATYRTINKLSLIHI